MISFLFVLLSADSGPLFAPLLRYQVPPMDRIIITRPHSPFEDGEGNFYCLDLTEKKIIMWDKHGKFLRTMGGAGEGPGEFTLTVPQEVTLSVIDGLVTVIDSRNHAITQFDREGNLVAVKRKPEHLGRIFEIQPYPDRLLFMSQFTVANQTVTRLFLTDLGFEIRTTFFELKDAIFVKNKAGGWDFHPANPFPRWWADRRADLILVGDSQKDIQVFDLDGNQRRTIRLPLADVPVTQAFKDRIHQNQTWLQNGPHRAIFGSHQQRYKLIHRYGDYLAIYTGRGWNPETDSYEVLFMSLDGTPLGKTTIPPDPDIQSWYNVGRDVFTWKCEEDDCYFVKCSFNIPASLQ